VALLVFGIISAPLSLTLGLPFNTSDKIMNQATNKAPDARPPGNRFVSLWQASKVLFIVSSFLGLCSLNVLTLLNDEVHAAGFNFIRSILAPALADETMSRLLSSSPSQKYSALEKSHMAIEAKHVELQRVSAVRSQVVKNMSAKIARRAVTNAAKNASSFAAEAIPVVGVAAIVAITVSDLYDDCQTLKDLNELNVSFEHEIVDENKVCGIKFP
jgi:hypothetical protein